MSIETDGIYINFVGTGVLDGPRKQWITKNLPSIETKGYVPKFGRGAACCSRKNNRQPKTIPRSRPEIPLACGSCFSVVSS